MRALDLIESSGEKREVLRRNTELFDRLMRGPLRRAARDAPDPPVMFPGDDGARRATEIADHMLEHGVYVIAFSFPVVPRGKAASGSSSAAHSRTTSARASTRSSRPGTRSAEPAP